MLVMDSGPSEDLSPDLVSKMMPCKYCNELMKVGIRQRKLPHHFECSLKVQVDNMRQISEKNGPYYDRWLAGQRNYLERLTRGGAPPNEGG